MTDIVEEGEACSETRMAPCYIGDGTMPAVSPVDLREVVFGNNTHVCVLVLTGLTWVLSLTEEELSTTFTYVVAH